MCVHVQRTVEKEVKSLLKYIYFSRESEVVRASLARFTQDMIFHQFFCSI